MEMKRLKEHLRYLITLDETECSVVSCYVNLESDPEKLRRLLDERIRTLRKLLRGRERRAFEEALGMIETQLASVTETTSSGVALFARGGEQPFMLTLRFDVSLPTFLVIDTLPIVYPLVELKDTYHRYILMISTEESARILEVEIGKVTMEQWAKRPEIRKRVGRDWTKEHYQNHRRDRTAKFVKEKIEILDRLVSNREHTYLILAGTPKIVAHVSENLPQHLRDKLIDVLPVAGSGSSEDAVVSTLARFVDHEQQESIETAELLLNELARGGLAVKGTDDALAALLRNQVDVLVLSKLYESPPGWACSSCLTVETGNAPAACPSCWESKVRPADLKEEMVRLAERSGAVVEIVGNSDHLLAVGGVGCLVRFLTAEQRRERR